MAKFRYEFSTQDPTGGVGDTWKVGIPEWLFCEVRKYEHQAKFGRIRCILEMIESPSAIYKGWCRQGTEECWVYEGDVSTDYRSLQIETPQPPGTRFVVFILPDGSIDDWTWREQDDHGKPLDVGQRVWPPTF